MATIEAPTKHRPKDLHPDYPACVARPVSKTEMMEKPKTKYGYLVKPEYPEPIKMKWQLMSINGHHGFG